MLYGVVEWFLVYVVYCVGGIVCLVFVGYVSVFNFFLYLSGIFVLVSLIDWLFCLSGGMLVVVVMVFFMWELVFVIFELLKCFVFLF